jgi:hypothetical protein
MVLGTSIATYNLQFCREVVAKLGFTSAIYGKLIIRFKNPKKAGFVKVKISKRCENWEWSWSIKDWPTHLGSLFYSSVETYMEAYFKPSRFPFIKYMWVKAVNA